MSPKDEQWSTSEVKKLINAYKKHECLWQIYHDGYKRKDVKEEAWESLSQELGRSVPVLKKKFKSLRAVFHLERKKYLAAQMIAAKPQNIQYPRLAYFNDMLFLAEDFPANETINSNCSGYNRSVRRHGGASITPPYGDNSLEILEEEEDPICGSEATGQDLFVKIPTIKQQRRSESWTTEDDKTLATEMRTAMKRRRTSPARNLPNRANTFDSEEMVNVHNNDGIQDEWKVVGEYIASQLRQIAAKDRKEADRLHITLVKNTMNILDKVI